MSSIDFNALALAPCIATFGDEAMYVPGGGAPVPVKGIFNRSATEEKMDQNTGLMRLVRRPTFALNIQDLPPGMALPCKAEILIIDHAQWEIVEPVPDHFGHLLLKLMKIT